MNVVIAIGDREAIPVRALPYVSPALPPAEIASGLSADGLLLFGSFFERPRLGGMWAYFFDNNGPVEMPTHTWIRYRIAFDARAEGLPPSDPEYRDEIKLLPAGAFVWKSDFEAIYGGKILHSPGEPENPMVRVACYEPLIPMDMREIIFEGLERFIDKPAEAPEQDAPVKPPAYLDRDHPCYSPKLAQAIECWLALFGDEGTAIHNRGYSDQISAWLEEHEVTSDQRALASVIQPAAKGGSQQAEYVKDYRDSRKKMSGT